MNKIFFYIYVTAFILTVIGLSALFANMFALGLPIPQILTMFNIGFICYFLGITTMFLKNKMNIIRTL
jgi:hypothetical protein